MVTNDPDTGAQKAISWIIPNETGLGKLDDYLVSIADLEELLGTSNVGINVTPSVRTMIPKTTWALPNSCDLS